MISRDADWYEARIDRLDERWAERLCREESRSARWKGLARRLWREVADLQRQLREAEAALADDEPDGRMVRGEADAETCRLSGWVVGDVLAGEAEGDAVLIQLTAIGEERILARRLGMELGGWESSWTLAWREWRRVEVDA